MMSLFISCIPLAQGSTGKPAALSGHFLSCGILGSACFLREDRFERLSRSLARGSNHPLACTAQPFEVVPGRQKPCDSPRSPDRTYRVYIGLSRRSPGGGHRTTRGLLEEEKGREEGNRKAKEKQMKKRKKEGAKFTNGRDLNRHDTWKVAKVSWKDGTFGGVYGCRSC
ncbi:hypothetical protein QTP86_023979 [Hemibagrus guttatus]|nr:hypothetical protein QTP86_023979 [Hemibagrus guttatus]